MLRSTLKLSAEDPPFSGTTRVLTVAIAPARAADVAVALREVAGQIPQHAAIVPLVDGGVADGHAFIVTPHITGESLDVALGRYGPAALADALPRLQQLADALDLAAGCGLCHGRLAPEEILVSDDDTRIVGVGVAAALRSAGVAIPVAGPYTAPEVLEGDEFTPAADQFAFGIIAYEWLFGRRLDPGAGPIITPNVPGVDAARLAHAFETATASDAAGRFPNCTEFVRAIADSSKVVAFTAPADDLLLYSSERGSVVDEAPLSSVALPADSTTANGGNRSAVWSAALILGLAAGAAAVWMYATRGETGSNNQAQEYTDAAIAEGQETHREVIEPPINPPSDAAAPAPPVRKIPAAEPRREADAVRAGQLDAGLLVHSTPAGALVTIDGMPRGTTPVAVRGLELGTRSVIVSLPGYRAAARQIPLTTERPSRALEIELAPATRAAPSPIAASATEGSLVVDSRPAGASVFVDGRAVGVTPLTLTITAGAHTVRMERTGYRPVTTRVEVKHGERARVAARLEGGQDER